MKKKSVLFGAVNTAALSSLTLVSNFFAHMLVGGMCSDGPDCERLSSRDFVRTHGFGWRRVKRTLAFVRSINSSGSGNFTSAVTSPFGAVNVNDLALVLGEAGYFFRGWR